MKSVMEELGPSYWAALHGTCPNGKTCKATELQGGFCDTIVCDHCKMGCKKLMAGVHDLKNIQLGKPVFDPHNFAEVQRNFADPAHTCIGICPANRKCKGGNCYVH